MINHILSRNVFRLVYRPSAKKTCFSKFALTNECLAVTHIGVAATLGFQLWTLKAGRERFEAAVIRLLKNPGQPFVSLLSLLPAWQFVTQNMGSWFGKSFLSIWQINFNKCGALIMRAHFMIRFLAQSFTKRRAYSVSPEGGFCLRRWFALLQRIRLALHSQPTKAPPFCQVLPG